ncbi:MAG: DegV family protein [Clostridia bacterium]|nr:DegV family protein [Clostridia bacterium]
MIQIVTDSTSDILQSEAKELDITVLPLTVRFGNEEFQDGVTITMDEFFARMETVTELPQTSQVTPETFAKVFQSAIDNGDEVVCVTISSVLSGTYQSATIAKDMVSKPEMIHVIDSMSASMGEALVVFEAIKLRAQGLEAAHIAVKLDDLKDRVRLVGKVRDLKYLVMGGRLNGVVGKIGTTLNLVPMLRLKEGSLHQAGICHGKAKVNKWFIEQLRGSNIDHQHPMIFAGTHCPDEVKALRDVVYASDLVLPEKNMMRAMGSGIGTHAGPGLLAIGWIEQ